MSRLFLLFGGFNKSHNCCAKPDEHCNMGNLTRFSTMFCQFVLHWGKGGSPQSKTQGAHGSELPNPMMLSKIMQLCTRNNSNRVVLDKMSSQGSLAEIAMFLQRGKTGTVVIIFPL